MLKDEAPGQSQWAHGAVPLLRPETHEIVLGMMREEPRGKVLDVPTGTGVLANRLRSIGFEVSCCDIDPSYFSIPDLTLDVGDLNRSLPYSDQAFDYVICLDGIEHTENPFNAVREFSRILKPGGKLILSLPNYLNIERRLRFLITGLFSKLPSPKKIGKERYEHLWMLHLMPLTYPTLKLVMEHLGLEVVWIGKDREKRRMKWLLPIVWGIRLFCSFWPREAKEEYHLDETLSSPLMMGGNTLILSVEKKR
jgi:2-polyprenyl-3-methyl-5-hydroxy-6-metoxy-1,4-benzoquinol methylase